MYYFLDNKRLSIRYRPRKDRVSPGFLCFFILPMPILRSAKKQLRQNETHRLRNNHFRDLFREARVGFERLINAEKVEEAIAAFPKLQKIIDTLAKKKIIEKNTAARRKSRFSGMIAKLQPYQK